MDDRGQLNHEFTIVRARRDERHCCAPAVAAPGGAQYVAAIKDAQARSMGYVIAMPLQKRSNHVRA
jgi:hypothetical protein